MLSFLNIPIKFVWLVPAIILGWTLLIGGPVTDLDLSFPFTDIELPLQEPLQMFADTIASLVTVLPFMEVIFNVFVWGIQIKLMLIIVDIIWRVVGMFIQS